MVTLKQLRYLEALSAQGHFGRAAQAVGISQPALSMQISQLEANLGVTLIERGTSEAWLTPDGEEVVRRADMILAQVRDLGAYTMQAREVLGGTLKLGVIPSIAPYLLPQALPLLQKIYPKLNLQIRETQTETLLRELAQGTLDLLLLALPVEARDVETRKLFDERFYLAVASARLSDRKEKTGAEQLVRDETLLLLEEGHCLRDQALNYCTMAGPEAMSTFGASSLATLSQLVANGYGVTLLPEMSVNIELKDERVSLLRFKKPEPSRSIGLVWRKTSPRHADFSAFGRVITQAAKTTATGTTSVRKGRAPRRKR